MVSGKYLAEMEEASPLRVFPLGRTSVATCRDDKVGIILDFPFIVYSLENSDYDQLIVFVNFLISH